jgi:hypothetical protein
MAAIIPDCSITRTFLLDVSKYTRFLLSCKGAKVCFLLGGVELNEIIDDGGNSLALKLLPTALHYSYLLKVARRRTF